MGDERFYGLDEDGAIGFEFHFTYAGDVCECFEGGGGFGSHFFEAGIGEDDVGRHTFFAGEFHAQFAQVFEELVSGSLARGFLACFGGGFFAGEVFAGGLHVHELNLFFFEEYAIAGGGEFEHHFFIGGHFEIAEVDELSEVVFPLFEGEVFAFAVGFDEVIVI